MLTHAHAYRVAAYLFNQRAVLATAAVEEGQLICNPRPQYADYVVACAPLDRELLADRQILINIDARQSNVAISIPSRATLTINSISSGVIT